MAEGPASRACARSYEGGLGSSASGIGAGRLEAFLETFYRRWAEAVGDG